MGAAAAGAEDAVPPVVRHVVREDEAVRDIAHQLARAGGVVPSDGCFEGWPARALPPSSLRRYRRPILGRRVQGATEGIAEGFLRATLGAPAFRVSTSMNKMSKRRRHACPSRAGYDEPTSAAHPQVASVPCNYARQTRLEQNG